MAKRKRQSERNHELDIIIPVYGRPDLLRECLQAIPLAGFDVDYKLIVVDDKSPAQAAMDLIYNTVDLMNGARLLKNEVNKGFPATANRGAGLGNSPAILFLNSDVILKPKAIRTMLDTLWGDHIPQGALDHPEKMKIGIVAPKLVFPEGGHNPSRPGGKIQHAGIAFNGSGKPFHVLIGWSAEHPKANLPRSMQAVSGACMMIRRETWSAIWRNYQSSGDPSGGGGFNEIYGIGTYEDIETCFSARGLGWRVVYEPAAVGVHHVGASIGQQSGGYPLGRNEAIFKARCGHLIIWDEWLCY